MEPFSTIIDNNGKLYINAAEVAKALGYKSGASAISHSVDSERHCSLRELLRRADFSVSADLENMQSQVLKEHWLTDGGMYQLILQMQTGCCQTDGNLDRG